MIALRGPASAMWRLTGLGSAIWGAALLWRGEAVWTAVAGRSPDEIEGTAIRVLGIRHLAQGTFELVLPGRLSAALIAIDLLHATSMLPLAIANSPRRRPALISAGFAASSAISLMRNRRGDTESNR